LHQCEATFQDEWGNTWYKGDMLLGGIWYHHIPRQKGQLTSYRLLNNIPPTFAYFHLVLKSKFSMLPNVMRKGIPRFLCLLKLEKV
jgi:hypothetical protein